MMKTFNIIIPFFLSTIITSLRVVNQTLKNNESLISTISQCREEDNQDKPINYILLFLMKNGIQVSNSLCLQYEMIKCEKTCCLNQTKNYQRLRFRCEGDKSNTIDQPYRQLELCVRTGGILCGEDCCMSGYCNIQQVQENANGNPGTVKQTCVQEKSYQEMCKNVGLLWCDDSCCGFTAKKHKCFSMNHFGIPYIRCPKESQPV